MKAPFPGMDPFIEACGLWSSFHDSLIGARILDYARREARIVCVGKRRGQSGISQREINALMIAQAREGRIVVRLKGGDAFIFGRAAE